MLNRCCFSDTRRKNSITFYFLSLSIRLVRFINFIEAYFYEFGIMFFERMYLGPIMDSVFELIEEEIPALFKKWYQWLTNDTDEETYANQTGEMDATNNLFKGDNKGSDSSGS